MNGSDKRTSPRYETNLNALVHPKTGKSWLCSVRDYCVSGMLLVEQDSSRSRRSMPSVNPGETVGIHFSVPGGKKEQHFRLEGKIVRVMDSGVGINFPLGMDDRALAALNENSGKVMSRPRSQGAKPKESGAGETLPLADAKSTSAKNLDLKKKSAFQTGGLKPSDSQKIVQAIRKNVVKVLPEMSGAIFKYMDGELLDLAKNAKSNAEQSEYFAAMSNLEKAKASVSQSFANDILDQIDDPRNLEMLLEERRKAEEARKQASAKKRVKLSLVNTEEFEDWLAVANIISRSERSYEKYLSELLTRMGMMVDAWGHKEANPLGTAVFTHAFDDAIGKVDLSKDVRQKVYTGFEVKAIPIFRKLYIATTKLLEETGLFPDLDEDYITPSDPKSKEDSKEPEKPDSQNEQQAVEEEEEDQANDGAAEEDEQELEELKEELRAELKRRKAKTAQTRSGEKVQETPLERVRRGRTGPRRKETGSAISNLYSTVRDLLGPSDDEDYDDEYDDHVELEEMHGLLQELQQSDHVGSGQRMPIRQQLMDRAIDQGRQRRISPEAMERLDVVENLVDSIEEDNLVSNHSKDWIRQLELTLDKVATQREDFLSTENPHRSMDVVNQLARLGGSESASINRHVEAIINEINENYDSNPEVFDAAAQKLQPLIERQNRSFTGNVQRTVKASEGQQTLANAQRAVVGELDQRLAGRQVPEVLMKLLMPGWRNLLVNTHLRQGQDSPEWREHVHALDQVMKHLEGNAEAQEGYIPPEQLLQQIESGLDSISFEPGQRVPLVNTLRQLLTGEGASADLPMVSMEEQSVAQTLGFENLGAVEEQNRQIREQKETDIGWKKYYERAQHLHVGEWLEFDRAGVDPEIAIIAWVSEDNSRMVFVNRRGVKINELSVEQLATMMHEGSVRILEESDIPLTDRASHHMLQNMHNQLTHQATHDELTGLINRKEFERELADLLDDTKRNDSHHVVAFLDLDQFKVINNTGGHDAGDKLLIDLGRELADIVPEKSLLSRLGGDEFGVLLTDYSEDDGLNKIKEICATVKAFRFEWEKEVFALTTSCGVVNVDSQTDSVTSILRGADSACYVAKEAGRDRIQVFESTNEQMTHRKDIMEFVSQIDQSLEKNRFVLNCQAISPIDKESEDHLHYEILLTVLDENDKPLPPQDFIVAAETYNRMGAIDRWVIKNAFQFIAQNILKLDHLGAFSINISGNSLTEDDFMEFVLEQFNQTRLPTSKVCFEITETAAIGNLDDVIEFMEKMKVIGVQFSLDDFGTGLSSYSYLRNLPVDYLKIDGIFVKDIKNSPSDYAVVKSINEIGHFMGKKTIAEFVEDDEVLEILDEIGVDFAQGFGVGHKFPIVELLN